MTILMGFGVFTMIPMWVQFTLAKSYSPLAHILESIKKNLAKRYQHGCWFTLEWSRHNGWPTEQWPKLAVNSFPLSFELSTYVNLNGWFCTLNEWDECKYNRHKGELNERTNFLLWQFQVHHVPVLFHLNWNPVFGRYEVKTRHLVCRKPGGSQQPPSNTPVRMDG